MQLSKQLFIFFIAFFAMAGFTVCADDDPMEPLNRRIGTWVSKTYQKKAEWTPKESTTTGEETIKWVLDKKFIQGDVKNADGSKGIWLMNYDQESKVYRSWFFGSKNEFPTGDTEGSWDSKAERMMWKQDIGNGLRAEMVFQYFGKEKLEWSYKIRDTNGKLMLGGEKRGGEKRGRSSLIHNRTFAGIRFMPRRPRICPAGTCFHLINRAVARMTLFEKQEE